MLSDNQLIAATGTLAVSAAFVSRKLTGHPLGINTKTLPQAVKAFALITFPGFAFGIFIKDVVLSPFEALAHTRS